MSVQLQNFTYTLAAGQRLPIEIVGSVVRCYSSSVEFVVSIDDGSKLDIQEGIGFKFRNKFKKLTLINGATAQTVKLYIGNEDVFDSRQSGSITSTVSSAETVGTAEDVSLVAATVTSLIAANADRQSLTVVNMTGATLRLGDSNVSATRGLAVANGLSMTFPNFSGQLYGFSTPGGDVSIMFTEN